MSDLLEFLAARLDEDEAAAKAAADPDPVWTQPDPARYPGKIEDSAGIIVYDEGRPTGDQAAHIVRHDPARVLREVQAKRRILYLLEEAQKKDDAMPADGSLEKAITKSVVTILLAVARTMAMAYSDRPGYDQAWDPGWEPQQ